MMRSGAKGEAVYQCDTCARRTRIPLNPRGLEVLRHCIITAGCAGSLHRITTSKDINATPAITPEVAGVADWSQRGVLYTHTQTISSATWNVAHDLASKPNVYTYVHRDSGLVEVDANVAIVDENNITITFAQAERGLAQCVATASRNYVNPASKTAGTTGDIPLTHSGELTIATLDTAANLSVSMTFNSPTATSPVVVEYLNVKTPSVLSAWNDCSTAIINGKRYTVRSYNIQTTPLAPPFFQTGAISSGSTAFFTTQYSAGQSLILLASAPHAAVDRIYDRYIDMASISQTQPQLYYDSGTLYAAPTVVKSTYPLITVV